MGILVKVLTLAVIGRALLSWFPVDQRNPLVTVLHQITEPILAPLRQVIPRIGMFDITPIVAIFILYAIDRAITSL